MGTSDPNEALKRQRLWPVTSAQKEVRLVAWRVAEAKRRRASMREEARRQASVGWSRGSIMPAIGLKSTRFCSVVRVRST